MRALLVAIMAVGAACAGAAPPSATPSPAASATASSAAVVAGDVIQIHAASGSTVTVRVREQLVRLPAPSDAVLVTRSVKGDLLMRPDGSFASGSEIVVDLTTLQSDQGLRDDFVKRTTLQTSRYPTATFTPKQITGLPVPFPSAGEWKATLVGDLKIRSTTKEITWDATVKRDAVGVIGTATTTFTFEDFGMQPPSAASVLSVVDQIRLEVNLVGTT
jgi:polyisoprenoid-binding protein YceI